MNCLEARKYIYDFVQGNWEEDRIEDFIRHIETCPDCKEELRVTHMIYHGLRSLEGKEDLQVERSYQKMKEEAGHFLRMGHFFSAMRLASETLVLWALSFSLLYFISGYLPFAF